MFIEGRPLVLKLRFLSGLEARHSLCRWREPPDCREHGVSGLKGLRFYMFAYRWLTPPALTLGPDATTRSVSEGILGENKQP